LARLYTAETLPTGDQYNMQLLALQRTSFSGACSLCYNVSRYRTAALALPVRDTWDLPAGVDTGWGAAN